MRSSLAASQVLALIQSGSTAELSVLIRLPSAAQVSSPIAVTNEYANVQQVVVAAVVDLVVAVVAVGMEAAVEVVATVIVFRTK